ncbi:MAG: DNA-3-methyladenine glycosylase [Pseudomonadota bacterium]
MRKLTPLQLRRGTEALCAADPALAAVIDAHGRCGLRPGRSAPFDTLLSSIIGQQLSVRAAASIEARVRALCSDGEFTAEAVRRLRSDRLRRAGLSRAKVRCAKALAASVHSGELDFDAHAAMADEAIVEDLVRVPGIGPWTAEMYLMFGLGRPDVLSVGDLGLRKAAQKIYDLDARPEAAQLRELAERWRPWRTIACWYLWCVVD